MSSGGQRWDCMTVTEYQQNGQTKSKWTKIGAAFTNRDGSIGVQLDALPLDGRLVLQVPLTREEREARFQNRGRSQPQQGNFSGASGGGGGGGRGGGRGFTPRQQPQQQSFQQGQAPPYEPGDQDPGYDEGSGGDEVPFR